MVAGKWLVGGAAIAACLTGADAFSVSVSSSPRVPLPGGALAGARRRRDRLFALPWRDARVILDGLGVRLWMRAAAVELA
jgi:hypothetical protein